MNAHFIEEHERTGKLTNLARGKQFRNVGGSWKHTETSCSIERMTVGHATATEQCHRERYGPKFPVSPSHTVAINKGNKLVERMHTKKSSSEKSRMWRTVLERKVKLMETMNDSKGIASGGLSTDNSEVITIMLSSNARVIDPEMMGETYVVLQADAARSEPPTPAVDDPMCASMLQTTAVKEPLTAALDEIQLIIQASDSWLPAEEFR